MKLKLCIHQKLGTGPGTYGSDGAGAELELELPDELTAKPAELTVYTQVWYGVLERAVGDQLARMAAKHATHEPTARLEIPGPWADRNGRPTHFEKAPPEGLEEYGRDYGHDQGGGGEPRNGSGSSNSNGYSDGPPSRRNGSGGGGGSNGAPVRNDPPKNGKQLIGWANNHGKYDELMKLAKAWNLGRIVDWNPDDVAGAFHDLSRPAAVGWGGRS